MPQGIPRATPLESLRFATLYTLPAMLRGGFIIEPGWSRRLARADSLARAAAFVRRLRIRYGGRSIWVTGPTGRVLLVLSQEDVRRVLSEPDEVFSPASPEKEKGLGLALRDSLLLSDPVRRPGRRGFNEAVLENDNAAYAKLVDEEVAALLEEVGDELTRADLDNLAARVGRRVIFGDSARDDEELTERLRTLRHEANWLGLRKWREARNTALADELQRRIKAYARDPEPGSLLARFADAPKDEETRPLGQVTHWMMAFDVLGLGIASTLALLGSHPDQRARAEAEADSAPAPSDLAYLRTCFLEGIRLWAPVPTLTRTTTRPVVWHRTLLPTGTTIMIPAALHHRNGQLECAHSFAPDAWNDGVDEQDWWINPFSRGPAYCAGRGLALLLGPEAIAAFLRERRIVTLEPDLSPDEPLPMTIDVAGFRYALSARSRPDIPAQSRTESTPDRRLSTDPG